MADKKGIIIYILIILVVFSIILSLSLVNITVIDPNSFQNLTLQVNIS